MPESAPFARRGHKGGARQTTLVGSINDAVLSIGAADLSTWAGVTTNGPATATIDLGTTSEETIEFTGITGNTLTGVTRGVGGTTPRAHSDNAPIVHSSQVRDYDEANQAVASVLGANPTVVLLAGAQTISGAKTFSAVLSVSNSVRATGGGNRFGTAALGANGVAASLGDVFGTSALVEAYSPNLANADVLITSKGTGEVQLLARGTADGGVRVGSTGAAPTLAFYNTAPIAKQTAVAITAAGIHAALVNLGLIT